MDASLVKRLRHLLCAAYYMLRKGLSKHKLLMDFDLLLKRSKLAGKAIGNFLLHHHNAGGADAYSAFSCRSIDPSLAFYHSKDVEFSCSNSPSYPSFFLSTRRRHHLRDFGYDADLAAAIVRGLETLSAEMAISPDDGEYSTAATPSPALLSWRSPEGVRQLRVTDSPFPVIGEGEDDGGKVDRRAEEFIKRFYEQLRLQKSVPVTLEDGRRRRKPA